MGRPRVTPDPKSCSKCGEPHVKCTGHRKADGAPCGQPRMAGQLVCRKHGGKAPQALAAAVRRVQEAEAKAAVVTLGLPVDISPSDALLDEVRWTSGHVQWLRGKVQELNEQALVWGETKVVSKEGEAFGTDTTHQAAASIWYDLYERERKHRVAVCAAALRAGVEERRVKLAEAQGEQVAGVIRAILADLGLSAEQQAAAPEVASRHLRLLAGGAA